MTAPSPLDRAIGAARRGHAVAARELLDGVLAADPAHEEALVWRARVAETDGERAGYLRRALAVNPDNRWAAGQLDGAAAPLPAGGSHADAPQVLACPNCGGNVEVHPERGPKAAACAYCGSVLDLTTRELDILGQLNPKVRPKQPIEPGDEATVDGERYVVIGWLQYEGWDSEERWRWDEWQLVSDSGQARYLSYSPDEGWLLQTPVRPTPKVHRGRIEFADGKARAGIHETSPARIRAMRGEFTWRPQIDAVLKVAEARRGSMHYSVELTADEVEVVGGPKLSEREVWTALGRKDKLRELDARIEARRRRRKALRRAALTSLAAAVVFFFAIGFASTRGQTVFTGKAAFEAQERDRVRPAVGPDTTLELYETAELARIRMERGTQYEIDVGATPAADAAMPGSLFDTEVHLQQPDGTWYQLAGNLFRRSSTSAGLGESGRTSLVRPRVSGEHRVVAYVRDQAPDRVDFDVAVRSGLWDPDPFSLAAVVSLLLAIVLFLGSGFGRID